MDALVTRVGERDNPYLVEFYDVNCPFCARAALNVWHELLSSGAYFELVYLPVHYSIWKDLGEVKTAEGSYLVNASAFCVDEPAERVKYLLELFRVTSEVRDERKAIQRQLEIAEAKFGRLGDCLGAKLGRLAGDPELAYELAHEYALALGAVVSGVPTALLVDGGKAIEVKDGYIDVENLIKKYIELHKRT
ncbi:DsbA family protein [Thermoproteus tenax]|uniref:DSBA oxidoreductase n=1 Tax=Thermoproteus tenax (strain ATCC 35583 / DSM 2078 / JCM 9277 / NBRC 100435 / Kra 1) TaxID=768679 RepID=G4RJH5_THETK|nr:DsbA family protein [Thermoproteus tenax]CCC81720.1 DSBA oxidoreductase [Thermoproteus tenax Kra 1]